jgi:hypothetical protein
MPKAFLITPFTPERAGNEAPEVFRSVQQTVARAVAGAGAELVHPAELSVAGAIMDEVRKRILEADIVLAILTGQNPNVFYELGIALERASRPAILIVGSGDDVPFDLRHHRYFTYGGEGGLERLGGTLDRAIRENLARPPRAELMNRHQAVSGRKPILDLKTVPVTEMTQLNFRSQATTLVGRDGELRRLGDFLSEARSFLWQSIHGPSGSGKSRLALDFCLSVANRWSAGFLPRDNAFIDEWSYWRPSSPTLIVIDEVELRTGEIRALLQALSLIQDDFDSPVRVLLLGRERSRHLQNLLKEDPFEWEAHFQPFAFGPSISLDALESSDASKIIDGLASGANWQTTILERDPALRLPLFSVLTGLALAAGRQALVWDPTSAARYVLERSRVVHWKGSTAKDENLLAYLSMIGPQSIRLLRNPPVEDLFPNDPEEALDHNQSMTGSEQSFLSPLRPQPLGELFVLDLLRRAPDPIAVRDRGHRVADAALRVPIISTDFVVSAMTHFPDHSGLPRLIAAMVPAFDASMEMTLGFGVPTLMDGIGESVKAGEIALARAYVNAVRLLSERNYSDAVCWGGYPTAAFRFITGLGDRGYFIEAIEAIQELETAVLAEGTELDELGKAYANLTISAVEQDRHDLARTLTNRVLELASTVQRLGPYAAGAAVKGVQAAATVEEAEGFFENCARLLEKSPENTDLADAVAKVGNNVANRAQRDQAPRIALHVFDRIWSLAEKLGEGAIPPALIARTAIPAGACILILKDNDQGRFIARLVRHGATHDEDEEALSYCVQALYNVVTMLGGRSETNAAKAFGAICQIFARKPQWKVNDCLAAAVRWWMSSNKNGRVVRQIRETLAKLVPAALDPEYLAGKGTEWGVDLSVFVEASK